MRATLLLLKYDPEGDWTREGSPLTFEDDPSRRGEEKARTYGDEWVSEDPEHRQYSVLAEKPGQFGWTGR